MRETLRGTLAAACQIICMPAFWILAHGISHSETVILPKRLVRSPAVRYIIVANHQSRLDPFVITGILPPRFWAALLPYRYMTANQYLYQPHLFPLLWPLGGFPAYPSGLEGYGLERAQQIITSKQTLCMFPEGKRTRPETSLPKRGITVVAHTKGVLLLPILLEWSKLPRRNVKVTVGEPFDAHGLDEKEIMHAVYALRSSGQAQPKAQQPRADQRQHKIV